MSRNQLSTLKISLKSLLLAAIIFIGCQEDEPEPECTFATIVDATGLDGCGWLIELHDGTRLEPTNLDDFDITLVDDLPVCVVYIEAVNSGSVCMAGTLVDLTSIIEGIQID